jgi:pantothenate synthetase
MSSRNTFLDIAERKSASQIIKLLRKAKKMHKTYNLEDIKYYILKEANLIDNFQIEYFEVINIADFIEEVKEVRAFIACKVGNTRLIDNIRI